MPYTIKKVNDSHLATADGIVAILLWSSTIALIRSISEKVGPVTAATTVYSFSSIAALVSLLYSRQRQKLVFCNCQPDMWSSVAYCSWDICSCCFLPLAGRTAVSRLNYLWPVLTLLLSLALLEKKANWGLLPGTLLSFTGIFMVITHETLTSWHSFYLNLTSNPAAYYPALAAALFWALYSNLVHKFAGGKNGGAVVIFLPITAIVTLLICIFSDEPREWGYKSLIEALFLGVTTYFAYELWDNAMRRGNIVLVASFSYITLLFSTIASCFYLTVMPGARLWMGCGFLILGAIISWRSVSSNSRSKIAQQI